MLDRIIKRRKARRRKDAERWADMDGDLCMLCHAYGQDKRGLFVKCLYAVHEAVPEVIDMLDVDHPLAEHGFYYLRICKSCRSAFLSVMAKWANERRSLRDAPKDHDGHMLEGRELDDRIPVRIHGAIKYLTPAEYERWRQENVDP